MQETMRKDSERERKRVSEQRSRKRWGEDTIYTVRTWPGPRNVGIYLAF